jgi:TusE/DsrC/DsvC family sulfur relay protein
MYLENDACQPDVTHHKTKCEHANMDAIAFDDEGYLIDPNLWSEDIARELAQKEGILLTEDHWEAIRFMREYYSERQVAPDVRHVMKHLSKYPGNESRNRIFELFPYGYVKQACKIAGMKRPRAWSTG